MNNNTPPDDNLVYQAFNGKGVNLSLVTIFGLKALVCLIGIIANLDILFITWKTKNLRSACNLQIAISAFSIAVQESSTFVTFAVVVTGINFIPLGICGILQAFPLFFTMFTNAITFSIGVDRLFSQLFPIWYLAKDKDPRYVRFICAACTLFSLPFLFIALRTSIAFSKRLVMCTVIDPIKAEMAWIPMVQLVINGTTVGFYLLVWALVACRKSNALKKKQIKIFKSLSVILFLELFGWISNYLLRLIIDAYKIEAMDIWYFVNIATISPYISMSLSPIALYLFSVDYRRAFLLQFGVSSMAQNKNLKSIALIQVANVIRVHPTNRRTFIS